MTARGNSYQQMTYQVADIFLRKNLLSSQTKGEMYHTPFKQR